MYNSHFVPWRQWSSRYELWARCAAQVDGDVDKTRFPLQTSESVAARNQYVRDIANFQYPASAALDDGIFLLRRIQGAELFDSRECPCVFTTSMTRSRNFAPRRVASPRLHTPRAMPQLCGPHFALRCIRLNRMSPCRRV